MYVHVLQHNNVYTDLTVPSIVGIYEPQFICHIFGHLCLHVMGYLKDFETYVMYIVRSSNNKHYN